MPYFLIAISLTVAVVLTEPRIQANERIRRLGKDTLGESVKVFQVRYPKARCGRITSLEITAQSLVEPGNTDDVHCCLNDNDSLSEVSRFPILNLDGCAVHAIFWKNRLCNLSYMLDVRSIQIVLDDFEKLYGSPARELKDPEDTTRLVFVDWMEDTTSLELKLCRLGGEDFVKDSTRLKGAPWLEVVSINLWNSVLRTARN
jgi:hypothetical protein